MKTIRILCCEDSVEGIFSAIYEAWASRYGHANIRIEVGEPQNYELFCEYVNIQTDEINAAKVAKSIREKISLFAYEMVLKAALTNGDGKADSIYRFLIRGFVMGACIVDDLSNPDVNKVFNYYRNISNEAHHFLGFLRFSELDSGVLFAKIRPQNNLLTLIAPHFTERLMDENFMIYDAARRIAVIHKAKEDWFLTDAKDLNEERLKQYSDDELLLQALWKEFVDTIAIKERRNLKLQQQNMPKRFWEFMPERN